LRQRDFGGGGRFAQSVERFVRLWFAHVAGILPIARAIAAAAASDDDARSAWHDRMDTHRALVRQMVDGLADSGQLSKRWSREEATDWFWSRVHLEVWQQLVVERGWTTERLTARVVESLWNDLTGSAAAHEIPAARGVASRRSARRG